MTEFTITKNSKVSEFPHYWELCVGSCHGYTALREDYRQQLKKAHNELGFKYVRFHGIFDDDMCVCVKQNDMRGGEGKIVYNFFNTDSIFDFLLSIGMKPFIEIGFMPSCLASGNTVCMHYRGNITPPKDYKLWNDFIRAFAEHCIDRYGIDEVKQWFFEMWNEPNLPFFFDGTQEQYFELYKNTATTLKSVSNEIVVGGPATSINAWIPEFINYCESNKLPLDFISTHHYPTDDPLWKNSNLTVEEFFRTMGSEFGKYERGIIKKMTTKAAQQAGKYPLYYTEWNTSAMAGDESHDTCYASSMIAKILSDNDGLVKGYSYWTFTDIFEESAQIPGAFYGGFGLQTVAGIEKPAYRLFELFHKLGNKRIAVESSNPEANVELLATKTDNGLMLVAYNHNVPGEAMNAEDISVDISSFGTPKSIKLTKIDENNSNPRAAWVRMGSPEYISKAQVDELRKASELVTEEINNLKIAVAEYGVVAIEIEF